MPTSEVTVFVQARMSSSRLPGKVLLPIGGRPMLEHVVERARAASTVSRLWVLTSTDRGDDPIADWCRSQAVECFRGSLHDVLDRFAAAAERLPPDHTTIVRITADCPLTDPDVIDEVVNALRAAPEAVYAASRLPDKRTFPIGIDVEAFRREGLERARIAAWRPYQREHVTPWFYDGSESSTPILVSADPAAGDERWTVATAEDLELVREIHERLPAGDLRWRTVEKLLDENSHLRAINAKVRQKSYRETEK